MVEAAQEFGEFLTVRDIAGKLRVTVKSVYDLIRLGHLEGVNIGMGSQNPHWRIRKSELARFLKERTKACSTIARASA